MRSIVFFVIELWAPVSQHLCTPQPRFTANGCLWGALGQPHLLATTSHSVYDGRALGSRRQRKRKESGRNWAKSRARWEGSISVLPPQALTGIVRLFRQGEDKDRAQGQRRTCQLELGWHVAWRTRAESGTLPPYNGISLSGQWRRAVFIVFYPSCSDGMPLE